MNIFKHKAKESRVWGKNIDGSPYVVGMTVGELRSKLEGYPGQTEICMSIRRRKCSNGSQFTGKLVELDPGAASIISDFTYGGPKQVWLKGCVLDPSQE